ncbi:glycoside hydrolase family 88 protein [Paenibacillus sp. JX-17]|uniref:Glycoside hydrolase family 88 protein n=1 Tax=Paenibacillus lacisoli TaxID=3064525 RepID=A0ABT9CC65_9BACL|nr:glycoside hydrolase family 88 protein [Paenibacillus sp. JX-17]MDO7906855.1 glycoside hydrolase family 88 protein [Paenibacillus sp. JX-17]
MTISESNWLQTAWSEAEAAVLRTARRIGGGFPHVVLNGRYDEREPEWWTAGFWPGLLWLVDLEHPELQLAERAARCEEQLGAVLDDPEKVDHDLGFIWLLSGVASYRATGHADSRRRALLAANLLAARYNVTGAFIRAWNFPSPFMDTRGVAIIDSMMNLPLLYWATEETGDPRYAALAVRHANTVAETFVREDRSIRHVVEFDLSSGNMQREHGGQGFGAGSAWARGTSWALHGFALAYGYTGDLRHLAIAENTADFFLEELGGEAVPCWDFRAPSGHREAWDSSAAAIAASGLLELERYSARGEHYGAAARNLVRRLHEDYTQRDGDSEGILTHGTVHYPEQLYVNHSIIYGDYFYVESLAKLRGHQGLFRVTTSLCSDRP